MVIPAPEDVGIGEMPRLLESEVNGKQVEVFAIGKDLDATPFIS
jgi:hypothetical protein